MIVSSQKLIATKARLDICAVRLATSRERYLRRVTVSNQYVYSTLLATYAARGLTVLTLGSTAVAQQAATYANQAAAFWQEGEKVEQQAREASLAICDPTPFSAQRIVCAADPPLIVAALKRDKAFFPDLYHVYRWKNKHLGSVTCFLAANPLLRTKLTLKGSPRLNKDQYSDAYAK